LAASRVTISWKEAIMAKGKSAPQRETKKPKKDKKK